MKNHRNLFSTVLLAGLMALPCAAFAKKAKAAPVCQGTVTAVDADAKTITVQSSSKKETTPLVFTVTEATRIIVNLKDGALADITPSSPVTIIPGNSSTEAGVVVTSSGGGKGKKKKKKGSE